MIKTIVIWLLLLIFSFTKASAQTESQRVLSATGKSVQVSGYWFDWSVGGTAVSTSAALLDGKLFTQGFLQPRIAVNVPVTLNFPQLPRKTYGDPDFILNASASDGSPVDFIIGDPTVATIFNSTVKIKSAGTARIQAIIRGTNITSFQTLIVDKASQMITLTPIPDLFKGDPALAIHAVSNKGFPVTLTNSNPFVITVSGNTLTPLDLGRATLTANAKGDSNYKDAAPVSQEIVVKSRTGEQISVQQVITPNGDGMNDVLVIKGIEDFPDNILTIVNRNGIKIYSAKGYNNSEQIFNGKSAFSSLLHGAYLPQGSYFYSLRYKDQGINRVKTGWIIIQYTN